MNLDNAPLATDQCIHLFDIYVSSMSQLANVQLIFAHNHGILWNLFQHIDFLLFNIEQFIQCVTLGCAPFAIVKQQLQNQLDSNTNQYENFRNDPDKSRKLHKLIWITELLRSVLSIVRGSSIAVGAYSLKTPTRQMITKASNGRTLKMMDATLKNPLISFLRHIEW